MLRLYTDDIIPAPAAIFVYNGAFDIARSIRNVSGCTIKRDVKLACNKHSDIAPDGALRKLHLHLHSRSRGGGGVRGVRTNPPLKTNKHY